MNIYVGNLSYKTTEDELRQHFEQYGEVASAKVITDRETGQSKGFGFVEMLNDGEANEAVEQSKRFRLERAQVASQRSPTTPHLDTVAAVVAVAEGEAVEEEEEEAIAGKPAIITSLKAGQRLAR